MAEGKVSTPNFTQDTRLSGLGLPDSYLFCNYLGLGWSDTFLPECGLSRTGSWGLLPFGQVPGIPVSGLIQERRPLKEPPPSHRLGQRVCC
jgi:hypothetical protein